MPYLGRMTISMETKAGRVLSFGIRDRLRLAREDAFPELEKTEFSSVILGAGKNLATSYESKSGTRIENMKDMILRIWAERCDVDFIWLKFGDASEPAATNVEPQRTLVHPPGLEPGTHWVTASYPTKHARPPRRNDSTGPSGRAA
jgi:hypothetical protein